MNYADHEATVIQSSSVQPIETFFANRVVLPEYSLWKAW